MSTMSKTKRTEMIRKVMAGLTTTDTVLEAIEATVEAHYAKASNADTVFADFGYPTPKKVVKTVAVKTIAVARTLTTRAARHTMGSRQKEKVVGVLPAAAPATTK